MKFGSVENPELVDFTLPEDHPETARVLKEKGSSKKPEIYVGCAKWNRQELKGFYPRGTKDELSYYSSQFNSIELNATFYQRYGHDQVETWREKTPENFKFFPKVSRYISHIKRLYNTDRETEDFCDVMSAFKEKLGMIFLQVHDNFATKNYDRLENFIENWPKELPLGVELRNSKWFEGEVAEKVYHLFETYNITNIIVDTAGRRDLLHMRLTTPKAFIRYVGANHSSDYTRLDDWFERIKKWIDLGIDNIYLFVHQNIEKESPLLSAYFIERLNKELGYDLKVPQAIG